MKILKYLSLYKFRFIYFAIGLIILLCSFSKIILFVLFIPYFLFISKQHKDLLKPVVILLFFFSGLSLIWNMNTPVGDVEFSMWISAVEEKENSTKYTGRIDYRKVIVYGDSGYSMGDVVRVTGEVNEIEDVTIPGGFDYKAYLKSQGISHVVFADELIFKDNYFHFSMIGEKIEDYIDHFLPRSKAYIKTLILADKSDFEDDLKQSINALGISHLFAVSGMHIGLLVLILKKGLSNVFDSDYIIEGVITLILLLYCIITNFTPSVLRASLMVILLFANNKLKHPFSSIDILSIVFLLLLCANPNIYLSLGFQLSFIVTFFLVLTHPILKEYNPEYQLLAVSLIAFYSTVPLIVQMNNEINMLTVLANIIFVPITTLIIVPLGYLSFVLPLFDSLYSVITTQFDHLIMIVGSSFVLKVHPNFSNSIFICLFYILFYKFLISDRQYRFKSFVLLNTFIVLTSLFAFVNPVSKIVYFDIDGESTLFKDAFNQCNILIDTGEEDEYDTLIQYLKQNQIYRIDYLIISHFHSDHYGEFEDIVQSISVENIITNQNFSEYDSKWLTCGRYQMFVYPQILNNDNENNNSVGVSIIDGPTHYFFLGDAEEEQEMDFIHHYRVQADVLKINHHGSVTSSMDEFIDGINPSIAYINVDRNNVNNHPNFSVIERLENKGIEIVRTDLLGTVENKNLFGFKWVKYSSP